MANLQLFVLLDISHTMEVGQIILSTLESRWSVSHIKICSHTHKERERLHDSIITQQRAIVHVPCAYSCL